MAPPPPSRSLRSSFFSVRKSLCRNISISDSLVNARSSAATPNSSAPISSFRSHGISSRSSAVPTPGPSPPLLPPPAHKSAAYCQAHTVSNLEAETVASGYAFALAELSESTHVLDRVSGDLDNLSELLEMKLELYQFFVNPVVVEEKKKTMIKSIAEDANYHEYTVTFLNVLVEKQRISTIKEVIREFEGIYIELTDAQFASVTSAAKIEKPQLALIAKKIKSLSGAKKIRLKNYVDPSLIAGFVIKYGKDSRFIDMSVKGQLDRLAAQFDDAEKVSLRYPEPKYDFSSYVPEKYKGREGDGRSRCSDVYNIPTESDRQFSRTTAWVAEGNYKSGVADSSDHSSRRRLQIDESEALHKPRPLHAPIPHTVSEKLLYSEKLLFGSEINRSSHTRANVSFGSLKEFSNMSRAKSDLYI